VTGLLFVLVSCVCIYRVYWCFLQGQCPIKVSEEVNNIRITIRSTKRYYDSNETVDINITIKNNRREKARLYTSDRQPALVLTYRTKDGAIYWHDLYPEIAYSSIIIEPGDVYNIDIHIPPEDQHETESGKICTRIQVNYPGGWNGGYGFGTCLTYNNLRY
jgi:hypothetical protein